MKLAIENSTTKRNRQEPYKAIADLRRDYQADTLDRAQLAPDPLERFQRW